MPADTCKTLRSALLDLHRGLVDLERRDYEKRHGNRKSVLNAIERKLS